MTNLLTASRVRELFEYHMEFGVFTWKEDRVCQSRIVARAGDVAGCISVNWYWVLWIDGCQQAAHRIAHLYMTGEWPDGEMDHRNGCRIDNSWANLRDVGRSVNAQNLRRARKHSHTGLLGAFWCKRDQLFSSKIRSNGRYVNLGSFKTAEAAHEAYLTAKRQLHAGCTI